MATVEYLREVIDAITSVLRYGLDRRVGGLSGANRTERSEPLWDSHLA